MARIGPDDGDTQDTDTTQDTTDDGFDAQEQRQADLIDTSDTTEDTDTTDTTEDSGPEFDTQAEFYRSLFGRDATGDPVATGPPIDAGGPPETSSQQREDDTPTDSQTDQETRDTPTESDTDTTGEPTTARDPSGGVPGGSETIQPGQPRDSASDPAQRATEEETTDSENTITAAEFAYGTGQLAKQPGVGGGESEVEPQVARELTEEVLAKDTPFGITDLEFSREGDTAQVSIEESAQREYLTNQVLEQVDGPINPRNLQFEGTDGGLQVKYTPRYAVGVEEGTGTRINQAGQIDDAQLGIDEKRAQARQDFTQEFREERQEPISLSGVADTATSAVTSTDLIPALGSAATSQLSTDGGEGGLGEGNENVNTEDIEWATSDLEQNDTGGTLSDIPDSDAYQPTQPRTQSTRAQGPGFYQEPADPGVPVIGTIGATVSGARQQLGPPIEDFGGGVAQDASAIGEAAFNPTDVDISQLVTGPSGETESAIGSGVAAVTGPFGDIAQQARTDVIDPSSNVAEDVIGSSSVIFSTATAYTPTPEGKAAPKDALRSEEEDLAEGRRGAEAAGNVFEGIADLGPMVIGGPETVRTLGDVGSEIPGFVGSNVQEEGVVEGSVESAETGADVAEVIGEQVYEQAKERPGFLAGTLVGTAGGIGLAAKGSSTLGRGTAFAIQPGEEIASAGLTRAFPGIASRIPGGRVDIEEATLLGAQRAGQATTRGVNRLRRGIDARTPDVSVEVDRGRIESAPRFTEFQGQLEPRVGFEVDRPTVSVETEGEFADVSGRVAREAKALRFKLEERLYGPDSPLAEMRNRPQRITQADIETETEADVGLPEQPGQIRSQIDDPLNIESDTETETGTESESGDGVGENVDIEQDAGDQVLLGRQETASETETETETESEERLDPSRTGTGFEFDTRFEADTQPTQSSEPDQPQFDQPGPTFDVPGDTEFAPGDLPDFRVPSITGEGEPDLDPGETIQTGKPGIDIDTRFDPVITSDVRTDIESRGETITDTETETETETEAELFTEFKSESRRRFDFPEFGAEPGSDSPFGFGGTGRRYTIDFLDPLSGEERITTENPDDESLF